MRFDVLGPLRVVRDDREVPLGPVKQRLLLAALVLRPGEVVGVEDLTAVLWGDAAPASAAANLRTYARGLRLSLGDGSAERMPPVSGGYLLNLEPGERDLDLFDTAAERGRAALAAGDPAAAETELSAALGLWRGTAALAGLPLSPPLATHVARAGERRLIAEEDHAEALLGVGAAAGAVCGLRDLLDRHPLRQRAWGHLMLGLYRIGDVSGALDAYRQARRAVVKETGLDPLPGLTRLYDDILHHRPSLQEQPSALSAAARPGAAPAGVRPEQLPASMAHFVGRSDELTRLDSLCAEQRGDAVGIAVAVVSGMAGVGKTALALHWARRAAGLYPDGHLYVDLRGYDAADEVTPLGALHGFLEALDVPLSRIPQGLQARAGLFRSLLASRRMLVVLDNARDEEQVRLLLPGTGLVVITSRNRLDGLVAAEGAMPLPLDVLPEQDAASLLAGRLGAGRLDAEPEAVASIIAATGGLPLALSIVSARAAAHPTFPLETLAAELRPDGARLCVMAEGDARRVFSCSYLALSTSAARLFRLLGLHPGPDLTTGAAAALAGEPQSAVAPLLRELTRLSLLSEHVPNRYAFHDLLRSYAASLARSGGRTVERRAALRRLYDHYLHQALPAAELLQPQWLTITPVPPLPARTGGPPADHAAALAWFTAEHPALLRAVRQAAETGFEAYAWQLAWALTAYSAPRGLWRDQLASQRIALRAAERIGDLAGQATAHRLLARASTRLGDFDAAEESLRRAHELYGRLGDPLGRAQTLHNHMEVCHLRKRLDEALAHGAEALRLQREAGHAAGEARTLNAIGWLHATAGDYPLAVARCTEALARQRLSGDRNGQAATLDSLGFAYDRLARHEEAVESYERAVDLFRASADRYHEAETLLRLGDTRAAMGDPSAAAEVWRRAACIFDELGDPAAEDARARLAAAG
ncbi:BTAD domain-containing putative transcriptional regulator [Streptomyces sp. SM10]|uniref:AfsR/SARP family transcriptional regulator n=1 Tax=Streptomyces sp. SM10 TaxID=565556 RepID=UPI000CD4C8AA|nr:BTAD domain-containing putative transcriptional regulator [Streptomyces sp. SM10]